ncbi:uncharacterized protein [Arachis hypogaea]|uniref:uncharacterized protein n=1 Tax=Arachis hypogaea TaxID=3818 RepID=UPI000DEC06D8|nr:uncharacterized protein LOC112727279 [Arachis hypogaea]
MRISRIEFLAWEVWKTRNQKIFQQQNIQPEWTIKRAKLIEKLFWNTIDQQFIEKKSEKNRTAHLIRWRAPPEDWLKANVDAAFRKEDGKGAISVVIRNNNGKIVLGFSGKISTYSSITAEAIAIRQALIIIENLNLGKILIESDNLKLIQTIKSNISIGETEAILQDIRELIKRLPNCGLTWTPREGNQLAHELEYATTTGDATLTTREKGAGSLQEMNFKANRLQIENTASSNYKFREDEAEASMFVHPRRWSFIRSAGSRGDPTENHSRNYILILVLERATA